MSQEFGCTLTWVLCKTVVKVLARMGLLSRDLTGMGAAS